MSNPGEKNQLPPLTRRCAGCGHRYEALVDICAIDGRALPPEDPGVADVGSYRLVQRLGDGGMGAVYRAVHRKLGRVVAIKMLQRELTADRGIINRFFHEARAANTIRHPHVIEIYDFIEDRENVYFVMELLIGQDVHDTVHGPGGGPMAPARAASILEQVAAALDAAHAHEIVHRDLKPENIFLDRKHGGRDFVKVIDFGIAKLDRPGGRATVEGAVLGTPEYVAPEQARGRAIDGRADIYSLGCVGYEMLTGRQAFCGGTRADVLMRQMKDAPRPMRQLAPAVPAALEQAILRALEKDPDHRPPTALAFAESIAQAMGRGLEQRSLFYSVVPRRSSGVSPPVSGLARLPRAAMRHPIAAGAVAVATAALLVGVGLAGRGGRPAPSPAGTLPPAATAPAPAPAAAPAPAPVTTARVLLQSSPEGAEILDDVGTSLGLAPQTLVVPVGSERQVTFRKPGFRQLERRFRAAADTTLAVRLDPEPPRRPRHEEAKNRPQPSGALDSAAGTIDPFRP